MNNLTWNAVATRLAPDSAKFDAWISKVDSAIRARCGLTSSDLTDQPYRDWFDDGISPANAARRAIRAQEG